MKLFQLCSIRVSIAQLFKSNFISTLQIPGTKSRTKKKRVTAPTIAQTAVGKTGANGQHAQPVAEACCPTSDVTLIDFVQATLCPFLPLSMSCIYLECAFLSSVTSVRVGRSSLIFLAHAHASCKFVGLPLILSGVTFSQQGADMARNGIAPFCVQ